MSTMHIGDFSAWICVEGEATPVYGVEKIGSGVASGWIASQKGKKFSVNWYNTERRIPLQAQVYIDGKLCDTHIMLDARRYPDKPNGVGVSYARTSDWTRRDFQFTSLLVSDDDAYLHTIDQALEIGAISIQIWRVEIEAVHSETLSHQYGASQSLDNAIVHEKSKKAGAHHVVYGEEYHSPAPMVDMVKGRTIDSVPLATFTFKYRPRDVLLAERIIPPSHSSNALPADYYVQVDERTAAQIRRLESRILSLKDKGRQVPSAGIVKRSSAASPRAGKHRRSIPSDAEVIDLTDL